jgi:predicted nucleic acid-binding protein
LALFLLDTDAFIDWYRRVPSSEALIDGLARNGNTLCVCAIVVAEVNSGLLPQHIDVAGRLIRSCLYLPTPRATAEQAGIWRRDLSRPNLQLSTTDVLIAATALNAGATVITGNVHHFPMPEISVLPLPRNR